jgi:hypothetical protein
MFFWQLAPSLISAAFILIAPGLLLARSFGARGWFLAGSAMPISVSVISVTAIVCGLLRLRWSVLPVFAASILLSLAVVGVRWLLHERFGRERGPEPRRDRIAGLPKIMSVVAILLPFAVIMWRFREIIGHPENISQTFDNIFHLNAVRYIEETGHASSLLVAGFTSSDGMAGFYPAAWHDIVSLVMQLSGAGIPQAVNATNMIIAAVLWPLSSLFLAVVLFGQRQPCLLSASVLSTGFASFPYLMVNFGVLYPNFLSIAVLPAAVALVVAAFRLGTEPRAGIWCCLLAFAGVVPGLALAHPSTLMALMPWTLPAILAFTFRRLRRTTANRKRVSHWWPVFAVLCYVSLTAVLWKALRPEEAMSTWEPIQTLSQAIGQALTSAPISGPVPWAIFVLTILGMHGLSRTPELRWFLGVYAVSCLAFVVVSGYPFGDLRTFVGGVWYNDPYRPAALLPVAALPVATFGAVWLWDLTAGWARSRNLMKITARIKPVPRDILVAVLGVCLVILFVGLIQRGAVITAVAQASQNYQYDEESALLSSDERELLNRIPAEVDSQYSLIANPWTGASLVYALADRKSLTAHVFGKYDELTQTVLQDLDNLSTDPEVCRAIKELKSYYLLDFGTKGVHGPITAAPGTNQLEGNPNFRLVDSEGSAKLYQITACTT